MSEYAAQKALSEYRATALATILLPKEQSYRFAAMEHSGRGFLSLVRFSFFAPAQAGSPPRHRQPPAIAKGGMGKWWQRQLSRLFTTLRRREACPCIYNRGCCGHTAACTVVRRDVRRFASCPRSASDVGSLFS